MQELTSKASSTRAIAIGIDTQTTNQISCKESLLELSELGKTAGLNVIHIISQQRRTPARNTYVGKGKLSEIKDYININGITCVLTDDELTPSQSKEMEKVLQVKIIDRTGLILEIFSQRAQTYEAKLQVELAQLTYLLPRLTRLWTHLSRLGGGIGTKGPGETQLETDKRQIGKRISHLKGKLKKVQKDRHLRRKKRNDLPVLAGAIVGYTNAGKSTLMNRLTASHVLAENALFATLDPISRQFKTQASSELVLTDTVGFIQKLPTHLIKAFYSTLEEVSEADFLIHVVDASHPSFMNFVQTSKDIINSLDASDKPLLYVFNKWDKVSKPNAVNALIKEFQPHICISATQDENLELFYNSLDELLAPFCKTKTVFIPYTRMDIVNLFHKFGHVEHLEYTDKIQLTVTINELIAEKIIASLYKKH
ncbi:GTPase HflX [bacterium]|nr:GTPase HflX [bacterium]